jgi:dienelactone hydrolase
MKKWIIAAACALFLCACQKKIETQDLTYQVAGQDFKGYLALPPGAGRVPGILIVHEWWGHNEYARNRARMLAELGYAALAIDMFGDGKQAEHPDQAGKFAAQALADFPLAEKRFRSAMELLQNNPRVEPQSIAAIGYCFGGGVVLNMARAGVPLRGVVSFHGSLGPVVKAQQGVVQAHVLVLHGQDDPFVPGDAIDAFNAEMKAAGVDYKFIAYPGAKHAFTNPAATENGKKFNIPLAYDEEADKKSWQEMQNFFKEVF